MEWWQILLIALVADNIISNIVKSIVYNKKKETSEYQREKEVAEKCWKLVQEGKISYMQYYKMSFKEMLYTLDKFRE